MTDAEAFLAKFKTHLAELRADLADAAEKYRDPAQQDEAFAQQLFALITFVEPWIKSGNLFPVYDQLKKIFARRFSRHGHGSDPVDIGDTVRRSLALALMELVFRAQGGRDEKGAARVAAAEYPPYTAGQLINLRKRANSKREDLLKTFMDQWVAVCENKHPGEPVKAAEELRIIAQTAKKVYAGPSQ